MSIGAIRGQIAYVICATVVVLIVTASFAPARSHADVSVSPFGGSLSSPVLVTAPPGDTRRQFILERDGSIWVVVDGVREAQPFLVVPRAPGEGQNVYSLAFAPDYATSGLFYVYEHRWDDTGGGAVNVRGRVQEFSRSASDPDRAEPASQRTVLTTDVMPFSFHVGGHVGFGADGMLYVSVGDGDDQGNPDNSAQRLDSLRGKLLRVDPRASASEPYSVPAGNPYPAAAPPFDLIYARGLRNPWRFAFDAAGGIFVGDPGYTRREEIDYAPAGRLGGANFGWNCFEGSLVFNAANSCPGALAPVHEYGPSGPPNCGAAVIGGLVVRDPTLGALQGRYLYGDFCTGQLRSFLLCDGAATDDQPVGLTVPGLTSISEDGQHRIYVTAQPSSGGASAGVLRSSSAGSGSCPVQPTPAPPALLSDTARASSQVASAPDIVAPVVTAYGLSNNRFVVGGSSTPTSGVAARRKTGTTFRYTLSEPATVRIRDRSPARGSAQGHAVRGAVAQTGQGEEMRPPPRQRRPDAHEQGGRQPCRVFRAYRIKAVGARPLCGHVDRHRPRVARVEATDDPLHDRQALSQGAYAAACSAQSR